MVARKTVNGLQRIEEQLTAECPCAVRKARQLAAEVVDPTTAGPSQCWNTAWRIPLFANAQADAAARLVERLYPELDGDWQQLSSTKPPAIWRTDSGKTNAAFCLGPLGERLRAVGGLACYRLFAIQVAARALEPWFDGWEKPFAQVRDWPVGERVERLHHVFQKTTVYGLGGGPTYWGHVTVAHLLTDLGLACKPDVHLNRSVRHLGLVDTRTASPPITMRKTIAVNRAVGQLAQAVYGNSEPATLRYLDKLLMEYSRKGFVGEPDGCGSQACR